MSWAEQGELRERVAIVTGATAGIGRSVCIRLAAAGARVVIVGRNPKRLEETLAEIRDKTPRAETLPLSCDVRSEPDMRHMAERTLEQFGRIDILVASAGILRARGSGLKTVVNMTPAEWDEVVDTNLKGLYLSNRAVLKAMIAQRSGYILNVSSTSARKAYAFDSAYCASKFGSVGLTEALAEEVRSCGIKVQILLPGAIDTPMWDQNGPIRRPEFALPVERVADVVLEMLAIPLDAMLSSPMVEPFGKPARDGWLGERADAGAGFSTA